MNLSDTERKSASGEIVTSSANTRLTGSWLIVARAVWLALVVPSLGLFMISLPAYYQQLQRACVGPVVCNNLAGVLNAKELQTLSASGFSVSGYAALFTIFFMIITFIWCGIGFLIFWRRSDDWLALLAAFFLVMFNIIPSGNPPFALALAYAVLALPLSLVGFLGQVSIYVFLLLFPNGRLVPRWMGLILLLVIIYAFFNNFPSPTSPFDTNWPGWLNPLVYLVLGGATIVSQIYCYRRLSTPVQRQQTKWVVLGVSVATGVITGLIVIGFLLSSVNNSNANILGVVIVSDISFSVAVLLIPLSIGFSILRYRLYDIDVLINRTLVYGTLTAILTLTYVGLILALQSLTHALTWQAGNQPVVIVGSTLVIAALFQPLRHRIQWVIDRRFYRRKYDAARTVAAFSATLRHEVELAQLSEHLIAVVQETMQPTHVSLWIRPASHERTEHKQS